MRAVCVCVCVCVMSCARALCACVCVSCARARYTFSFFLFFCTLRSCARVLYVAIVRFARACVCVRACARARDNNQFGSACCRVYTNCNIV